MDAWWVKDFSSYCWQNNQNTDFECDNLVPQQTLTLMLTSTSNRTSGAFSLKRTSQQNVSFTLYWTCTILVFFFPKMLTNACMQNKSRRNIILGWRKPLSVPSKELTAEFCLWVFIACPVSPFSSFRFGAKLHFLWEALQAVSELRCDVAAHGS